MSDTKKCTVSFIIPSLSSGGAERVVANLANQFVADGYNVIIYTILDDKETYAIRPEVKHIYLNVNCRSKVLRILKRFFKLHKYVKFDESQCIIAFDRYYGICSALRCGKKVIGSERNDPYSNMSEHSFQKYFRDYLYNRVNYMVFQTVYAQQYFSDKIQKHSTIIPNPITTDILPELFSGTRKKNIYTACRLTEQKNIPMMIEAFARFSTTHPDYTFTIYGDGPLKETIKKQIHMLKMDEKIKLAGYTDNLPQKVRDAGMFLSSSNYEGISNAMLEALAMGIPSVCTDCPAGGAAAVIQNGINGYLVPVGDTQAMLQAMCRIADNHELAKSFSLEAIKVRDTYAIKEIAAMWEEILQ